MYVGVSFIMYTRYIHFKVHDIKYWICCSIRSCTGTQKKIKYHLEEKKTHRISQVNDCAKHDFVVIIFAYTCRRDVDLITVVGLCVELGGTICFFVC